MWQHGASRMDNENPIAQVVNIEAELDYWRAQHMDPRFNILGATRSDLEDCIKLGYDAYLLNHRSSFEEIQPLLRDRYQKVRARDHIPWHYALPIMEAVWGRLKAPMLPSRPNRLAA